MPDHSAPAFRCIAVIDVATEDSLETNQAMWREDDPFLALRESGARRYVRAMSQRNAVAAFRPRTKIGAAQFWTDDEETALALHKRLGERALLKPHPLLKDARLTLLVTREIIVVGDYAETPGAGLKGLFIVKRKPGLTPAFYRDYWLNVHGQMVPGCPGIIRYLQAQRLAASYRDDDDFDGFDGATEMSWPDMAGFEAYSTAEPYRTNFVEDTPKLWDMTAGIRLWVKEEVVFNDRP